MWGMDLHRQMCSHQQESQQRGGIWQPSAVQTAGRMARRSRPPSGSARTPPGTRLQVSPSIGPCPCMLPCSCRDMMHMVFRHKSNVEVYLCSELFREVFEGR